MTETHSRYFWKPEFPKENNIILYIIYLRKTGSQLGTSDFTTIDMDDKFAQ